MNKAKQKGAIRRDLIVWRLWQGTATAKTLVWYLSTHGIRVTKATILNDLKKLAARGYVSAEKRRNRGGVGHYKLWSYVGPELMPQDAKPPGD